METLMITKDQKFLYKFISYAVKYAKANGNYYSLNKIGNKFIFQSSKYTMMLEMKNEILKDQVIDCIDGEYKIYKSLSNSYYISRVGDAKDELLNKIITVVNESCLCCRVSTDDTYKIHEVCQHVMIPDEAVLYNR